MSQSFMPGGSIAPMTFCKLDTTVTGGRVLQAGAGDVPFGISQPGTQQAPIVGLDNTFAGTAGISEILVFTETDVCQLTMGSACAVGDLLKPSTLGVAIPVTSNNDAYGAVALQSCPAAGQIIRAKVRNGYYAA